MECSRRRVGEEKAEKVGGSSGVGVWSKRTGGLLTAPLGKICGLSREKLLPLIVNIASINRKYWLY